MQLQPHLLGWEAALSRHPLPPLLPHRPTRSRLTPSTRHGCMRESLLRSCNVRIVAGARRASNGAPHEAPRTTTADTFSLLCLEHLSRETQCRTVPVDPLWAASSAAFASSAVILPRHSMAALDSASVGDNAALFSALLLISSFGLRPACACAKRRYFPIDASISLLEPGMCCRDGSSSGL